ncbi:Hypothetical predicted protein, partial [Podarcis lilfordi]
MSGRLAGLPAAPWAPATSLLLAGRERQFQPGGARAIIAGNCCKAMSEDRTERRLLYASPK